LYSRRLHTLLALQLLNATVLGQQVVAMWPGVLPSAARAPAFEQSILVPWSADVHHGWLRLPAKPPGHWNKEGTRTLEEAAQLCEGTVQGIHSWIWPILHWQDDSQHSLTLILQPSLLSI